MSVANATVTGQTGPALTETAKVYANVKRIDFEIDRNVLHLTLANGIIHDIDYQLTTTVTWTITGANGIATVTIS